MVAAGCSSVIICFPAVFIVAAVAVLILNKKQN
jgi:hypothetical protein